MNRLIVAIAITGLMSINGAIASEIRVVGPKPAYGFCFLEVYGTIDEQTPIQIRTTLTKYGCKKTDFSLNSGGGDANAAMECGRIIRRIHGSTNVLKGDSTCASACVLLMLGGVQRGSNGRIGLHRPFSTAISNSTVESRQTYEKTNELVKKYLVEMNIPERLLDVMNSIPPENVKWLSYREMEELWIVGVDPAFQDAMDSGTAKNLGISKQELYRRIQEADRICGTKYRHLADGEYHELMECRRKLTGTFDR
jgi:hypothetical protein